jgi:hypothetical protein
MAIDTILAQIDAEISRLTQIRSLLANSETVTTEVTERKPRKVAVAKAKAAPVVKTAAKKKRVLSAEARARIAEAQRKRWAAQKAS